MDAARAPHVLVMNDSRELLDLLQALLEEEGYRVTTAIRVLEFDKVMELAPDVIVLDIMFNGQDAGWEFLGAARVDPRLRRAPVVLCTAAVGAVSEPAMAAKLADLRVDVVLKPFDLDVLLAAVGRALAADPGAPVAEAVTEVVADAVDAACAGPVEEG